jgi:ribonuclease VapC
MKTYILDTSAILAFIEDEAGADEVQDVLVEALDGNSRVIVSVISLIEVYYISHQEQVQTVANDRIQTIGNLPIEQLALPLDLVKNIGKLKAAHSISFADSCIAGVAKAEKATLVHKDPEYGVLEKEIKQLKLPYKKSVKKE